MNIIRFEAHLHYMEDYHNFSDSSIVTLCDQSKVSIDNAYAPYSNFHVGAAILFEDNHLITGSNQENAVYPLGLCAERVALFAASSQYPHLKINALAVATSKELSAGQLPPFPCGSCRQVLLESEQRQNHDIKLYIIGGDDSVCIVDSVKSLLPFAFDQNSL